MSPTSTVPGYTISDLTRIINTLLELPGGLVEVEVPAGPIPGAYVNKSMTLEQLGDYLQSLGSGLPAGTVFRDPLAIGDNLAVTAAVLDAGNTWSNGDLTAYVNASQQSAGAPPAVSGQHSSILVGTADVQNGDQFDGTNTNGSAYRFFYGRRNDGTSGWTRLAKL